MNIFQETIWNSHRVRHQKDAQTPKGIPNHLYSFPDQYGAEECGMKNFKQYLSNYCTAIFKIQLLYWWYT